MLKGGWIFKSLTLIALQFANVLHAYSHIKAKAKENENETKQKPNKRKQTKLSRRLTDLFVMACIKF